MKIDSICAARCAQSPLLSRISDHNGRERATSVVGEAGSDGWYEAAALEASESAFGVAAGAKAICVSGRARTGSGGVSGIQRGAGFAESPPCWKRA